MRRIKFLSRYYYYENMWYIMDTVGSDLKADLFSLLYIQPLISFPKNKPLSHLSFGFEEKTFSLLPKNVFFS
jgi:hypothetical protein